MADEEVIAEVPAEEQPVVEGEEQPVVEGEEEECVQCEPPIHPSDKEGAGEAFKERGKRREIEQCFFLNDFAGTGRIPNENIRTLMRQLGSNAGDNEIPEINAQIDPENTGIAFI